mmetsp:Transcript_82314/g.172404  ORF Transcript_82314/g.172404 Transcript_82314/m.172404 type:complete len:87 (+) Transcript_82314:454-714(+)
MRDTGIGWQQLQPLGYTAALTGAAARMSRSSSGASASSIVQFEALAAGQAAPGPVEAAGAVGANGAAKGLGAGEGSGVIMARWLWP